MQINSKLYKNTGFTLVELIVVIVILAILALITFTSFSSYVGSSKDAVRKADISLTQDAFELYRVKRGIFPDPSNSFSVVDSGSVLWIQGTLGESVFRGLELLSKKPVDPLTGTEYTYSIIHSKTEYQIASLTQSSFFGYSPIDQASADGGYNAYVKGTFNGQFIRVNSGGIDTIIATPSIISSDINDTSFSSIFQNKKFVYNGGSRLPPSYGNLTPNTTPWNFSPGTGSYVVYTGSVLDFFEDSSKSDFALRLIDFYKGSLTDGERSFEDLIASKNNNQKMSELVDSYLDGSVGGLYPIKKIKRIYENSYCKDGKFSTYASPQTNFSADTLGRIGLAVAWIQDMIKPFNVTTTNSSGSINPSKLYESTYLGTLTGAYSLINTYPSTPYVSIETPSIPISDSYRGTVTGKAFSVPNPTNDYEVRAILFSDAEYEQSFFGAKSDIQVDGTWSINLSSVPGSAGSWRFALFSKSLGNKIGATWPIDTPVYTNLNLELIAITDAEYPQLTLPLPVGGNWTISGGSYSSGTKKLLIRDTITNQIVAQFIIPTGVIQSYLIDPGHPDFSTPLRGRGFVYDQALALLVMISQYNSAQAKILVNGLLRFQQSGAFVFGVPQMSPNDADRRIFLGAHSIATHALLSYIETFPNDPDIGTYRIAAINALSYIDTRYVSSGVQGGLYTGGEGSYDGGGNFIPGNITWAATEHNLDTWYTLMEAGRILGDTAYTTKANNLKNAILTKLWNPGQNRFYQGMQTTGPDTGDALDTNTWGAIFLSAVGEWEKARSALVRAQDYIYTNSGLTGYVPYITSGGYPSASPTLWYEGTYGASLAYLRTGLYDKYIASINQSQNGQAVDGSFVYASQAVPAYEISSHKSVASTAWYVLGTTGRDYIFNACDSTGKPKGLPLN